MKYTDYKYGFNDGHISVFNTGKGLNENVVRTISRIKNEPEWMLDFRLKALKFTLESQDPNWGPKLSDYINFDEYTYFNKATNSQSDAWDEVPEKIKNTFNKLGIPEAEQKFLAGASTQYESEVVYHKNLKEIEDLGVIYTDTDTALQKYPDIFKRHFNKIIPYQNHRYSALNGAVWSGGSFIYVPKGVKLEKPLQSYFRINSESMGQFERTLIIAEEDSQVHYIEGCTAPKYTKDSLHSAVVEIYVGKNAKVRYTTIQNWSDNVINLVTKRAFVDESGLMEWIDGNIGSHVNMKYPSCVLAKPYARGYTLSIAVANSAKVIQDAGAKMIHLAPYTKSQIISKSVAFNGGKVDYRGTVHIEKNAEYSSAKVQCDTLLLDEKSLSSTIPTNIVKNSTSSIDHEASVSKVSQDQLDYLMSRGLSESEAIRFVTLGFLEPFAKELPMEYAVELNQLIKMDMEGSIG